MSSTTRKYYNHKLHIASQEHNPEPLVYVDVPDNTTDERNTAPQEVRRIDAYLSRHPDKQVGIITPFARQRAAIEAMLRANHYDNASCGTVHAFQGDEKDVVIFSLALTDQTREKTYAWLKTNKELINVATSRARDQLVILIQPEGTGPPGTRARWMMISTSWCSTCAPTACLT